MKSQFLLLNDTFSRFAIPKFTGRHALPEAFLALLLSLLRTMAFLHGPSAELLAVVLAGYLLAALVVLGRGHLRKIG
jgi:hypothetical protein